MASQGASFPLDSGVTRHVRGGIRPGTQISVARSLYVFFGQHRGSNLLYAVQVGFVAVVGKNSKKYFFISLPYKVPLFLALSVYGV